MSQEVKPEHNLQRNVFASFDPFVRRAEELAKSGTAFLDLHTGTTTWSAGMFRLTNFDSFAQPPDTESFIAWVHPDDRENYTSILDAVLREGMLGYAGFRHIDEDGKVRHFQQHFEPQADDTGEVINMLSVLQEIEPDIKCNLRSKDLYDNMAEGYAFCKMIAEEGEDDGKHEITKRKIAEIALKEERERFTNITDSVPGVILSMHKSPDNSFTITFASPQCEDLFGVPPVELLNDTSLMFKRIHPDDLPYLMASAIESADTMKLWMNTIRYNHPSKGEIWVAGRSMPSRGPNGEITWHGFLYDVSDIKHIENALRESEERFRGLYDNASIGIYRTTLDGKIILVNPAGLRMLGFETMEELAARNLEQEGFVTESNRAEFIRIMVTQGFITGLESQWVKKDGTVIQVRESAVAIRDAEENIEYFDGTFEDITDWKKIQEQAFRWMKIFNDSNLNLAITSNKDNTFLQVNPAYARHRGYSPQELFGKSVFSIYHPDWIEKTKANIRLIDQSRQGLFESVHIKKDGTPMPVLVDLTVINDEEGNPSTRVAYALDISEQQVMRKRQDATLELLKICNKADTLYDLLNDLLAYFKVFTGCETIGVRLKDGANFPYFAASGFTETVIDPENKLCILDLCEDFADNSGENPSCDCLCGKLLRNNKSPVGSQLTEKGSYWTGNISDVSNEQRTGIHEKTIHNRCYACGFESMALIPMINHGMILGLFQLNDRRKNFITKELVVILEQFMDYVAITVAKFFADEEVRKLNESLELRVIDRTSLLEAANKDLEAFTYSVSHDLRAPLRAIAGFSHILTEDYAAQFDIKGKQIAATIIENTYKMSHLIDDLLAFSKLGRTDLVKSRIDMQQLVFECIGELSSDAAVKEKIRITTPLPKINADRALIKQVWLNLLANAVKFSSKVSNPTIRISCSIAHEQAVFSVADNGVGFDMKYVNKLFGVFQRLHSQKEYEGTGVGLAIVHRIIQRHHGTIWAESAPGLGATFSFSLRI